jgi:Mce-associated membrane protein
MVTPEEIARVDVLYGPFSAAYPGNAVVLVAASSQVTNSNGARNDPRPWRMSVTMSLDENQWKMSNVEFVP